MKHAAIAIGSLVVLVVGLWAANRSDVPDRASVQSAGVAGLPATYPPDAGPRSEVRAEGPSPDAGRQTPVAAKPAPQAKPRQQWSETVTRDTDGSQTITRIRIRGSDEPSGQAGAGAAVGGTGSAATGAPPAQPPVAGGATAAQSGQPGVGGSGATPQPYAGQPGVGGSGAPAQPYAGQPGVGGTGAAAPPAATGADAGVAPSAGQRGQAQQPSPLSAQGAAAGAAQPGVTQPGVTQPGAAQPGAAQGGAAPEAGTPATAGQPAPGGNEQRRPPTLDELQQRLGTVENGLSASGQQAQQQREQAQRQQQELQQLQQNYEQLQQRSIAIEQSRRVRATLLGDAVVSLRSAQDDLAAGARDVDGRMARAQSLLQQAVASAGAYAATQEAQRSQFALQNLTASRTALGRDDLYYARIYLTFAISAAIEARQLALSTSNPLFPATEGTPAPAAEVPAGPQGGTGVTPPAQTPYP